MTGIAGIQFKNDIISLLESKWVPKTGGRKPKITVVWEAKDIGRGNRNYDEIIIRLDSEAINIFSLRQGSGTYDWLHDLSVSIDIWTSNSERRSEQLADEVIRIIQTNVLFTQGKTAYIQLLPTNIEPLHEDFRSIYRWMIDCEAIIKNP